MNVAARKGDAPNTEASPPSPTAVPVSFMDAIVITGCGWVTPFAAGNIRDVLTAAATSAPPQETAYWPVPDDLLQGASGITPECRQDQGAHLAAVALEYARRDALLAGEPGIGPRESGVGAGRDGHPIPDSRFPTPVSSDRVGMVLGCALAGQSGMIDFANDVRAQSARFVSPIRFPQTVGNYIAGALARAYDIRGPNSTLAGGIASGLDAIVEGCAILQAGAADVMYAGGVDRLTPSLASGLQVCHCSASNGLHHPNTDVVFSDGACWFILEREREARQRGVAIQAIVIGEPRATTRPRRERCPRADDRSAAQLHSVAGPRTPGAIWIEAWIGRCLGALGAAALAAGIGAARGFTVPTVDASDPARTTVEQVSAAAPATVSVSADADGRQTNLTVQVPTAG